MADPTGTPADGLTEAPRPVIGGRVRFVVRDVGRSVADLARYAWRTGRWWFPVLIVVLAAATAMVAAAKVVVPTVVYTLF